MHKDLSIILFNQKKFLQIAAVLINAVAATTRKQNILLKKSLVYLKFHHVLIDKLVFHALALPSLQPASCCVINVIYFEIFFH